MVRVLEWVLLAMGFVLFTAGPLPAGKKGFSERDRSKQILAENANSLCTLFKKFKERKMTPQKGRDEILKESVRYFIDYHSELVWLFDMRETPPEETVKKVREIVGIAYHLAEKIRWTYPRDIQALVEHNYNQLTEEQQRDAKKIVESQLLDIEL